MKKKFLAFILIFCFVLGLSSVASFAADSGFSVSGGTLNTDYTYSDGVLTVLTDTVLIVGNAGTGATSHRIVIKAGSAANLWLNGVNIDVSGSDYTAALLVEDGSGDVTVTLCESSVNTLKSGHRRSGLQKMGTCKLTISGSGALVAYGGYEAPGIGGGYGAFNCYNVTISEGTITAVSGDSYSCGIGCSGSGFFGNFTITGGSVKTVDGANAKWSIGDMLRCYPTDGEGNDLYLLKIDNPDSETVLLDGSSVTDSHSLLGETSSYLYVKGGEHTVYVGSTEVKYHFKDGVYHVASAPTGTGRDGTQHWTSYSCCDIKENAADHDFYFVHDDEYYWEKCSCGYEKTKKPLPTLELVGKDKACLNADYEFSFIIPDGATVPVAGVEFLYIGDSGAASVNGNVASGKVYVDESYIEGETDFNVVGSVLFPDGFTYVVRKTVGIQPAHGGGTATCCKKATCTNCGSEYGELNIDNHSDLKHFAAKAATSDAEGNVEYWYCSGCGKYYSDAEGANEVESSSVVIAKLPAGTSDADVCLWITVAIMSAVLSLSVATKKFLVK